MDWGHARLITATGSVHFAPRTTFALGIPFSNTREHTRRRGGLWEEHTKTKPISFVYGDYCGHRYSTCDVGGARTLITKRRLWLMRTVSNGQCPKPFDVTRLRDPEMASQY